jgi:Flagellar assembly protein T, N-terminal domain
MMRAFAAAAAIAAALSTLSAVAAAQEPSFEALGQAPIVQGDRVRARERALDEAMRQAVEQATATVLQPAELVARSSDLRLRIYPKARQYVTTYHILDEGEQSSGTFQVHLSAQVATARLARDLAATQPPPTGTPAIKARAVVCSLPPKPGALDPGRGADASVREVLSARGVELAPPPTACTEESAAAAARAAGAQGAVVAVTEAAPAGPIRGTDRVAAHARVRLVLIEPDGRASADGAGEDDAYDTTAERAAERASRRAGEAATRALEPHLVARWPTAAPGGGVRVRVVGFARWADFVALERALGALPGVGGVEPRRFQRGQAELLVRTAQAAAQLADALRRAPPPGAHVTTLPDGIEVQLPPPVENP